MCFPLACDRGINASRHRRTTPNLKSNQIEWIQDGAYIRGLFLEGARWDAAEGSLNDSRPKQLYTPLPVLHLDPEQHRKNPDKGVYRCPVYKVSNPQLR